MQTTRCDNLYGANTMFSQMQGDVLSLFVFPPRLLVQQVIRPYTYNFSPELPTLLTGPDPQRQVLDYRHAPDSVLRSVVPATEAVSVDTKNLAEAWTFILIVDKKEESASEFQGGCSKRRMTLSGYFVGEPIAQNTLHLTTPIVNPGALLLFTHVNDIEIGKALYGQRGTHDPIRIKSTHDLVHQAMGAYYSNEMGLCDISQITLTNQPNPLSPNSLMWNGHAPTHLSEMTHSGQHISGVLQNPHGHMSRIVDAAGTAHAGYGDQLIQSDNILNDLGFGGDSYRSSPHSNAIDMMYGRLQKTRLDHSLAIIIDPTIPTTMEDLNVIFGNKLRVYPSKSEMPPQLSVRNPYETSVENIIGYMVANTIISHCNELGISFLQFKYTSWSPSVINRADKGVWSLDNIGLVVEPKTSTNMAWQQPWENLRYLLDITLFPIIRSHMNGSEFVLVVNFSSTTDTYLSLQSMDNGRVVDDFSVIHNRFGGLLNPNLGTFATLHGNTNAVGDLLSNIGNEIIGQPWDMNVTYTNQPSYSMDQEYDDSTSWLEDGNLI